MAPRRVPVSLVCVFNDAEVRRRCLDRSIAENRDGARVEYLPVDNVDGSFATAGAALNFGASQASHDYVAFVHQDVYLHALAPLEAAAGVLAEDSGIGLLGATGVTREGTSIGRLRDRVLLVGERASEPTDVDSLDEVLFMIPRRLLEREPLSDLPELAWHAYAIEYGLRARSLGLRVCALDIPLTHNSLTVNLDRLDLAYRAVAAAHPDGVPVRATCGTVGGTARGPSRSGLLSAHRWRYRWLRESFAAHAARRAVGGTRCVLGDIRMDIDEVIAGEPSAPLLVVNLDREAEFPDPRQGALELVRQGRPIMFSSQPFDRLVETIIASSPSASTLLTNLELADLRALASHLAREPHLLGFRREIGFWMLLGTAAETVPGQWRSPKATPLGMPALA